MRHGNELVFDAVRGSQGKRVFYGTMCSFGTVAKFDIDGPDGPARPLRKSAIPEIAEYLKEKDYILSSIAVAIDGRIRFRPEEGGRGGMISVPMDATILVNDGRLRCRAIREACRTDPALKTETIPVIMYEDVGLAASGQMFEDFRATAAKNTKSTKVLHGKDAHSVSMMKMILGVPLFRNRIETEETNISNRSTKLFTLASVSAATRLLTGGDPKKTALAAPYWKKAARHVIPWRMAVEKKITPYVMRQRYICANGRMLCALGIMGSDMIGTAGWQKRMRGLEKVDWSRKNPQWAEIMKGERMSTNHTAVKRAAKIIYADMNRARGRDEG